MVYMIYILLDIWFTKLTRRQRTSPSLFRPAQTLQSEKRANKVGSQLISQGQVQTLKYEEEKTKRKKTITKLVPN